MKKTATFLIFLLLASCGSKNQEKENHSTKQEATKPSDNDTDFKQQAERGKSYAMGTGKVLIKNLIQALEKKGTVKALAFCNEQAYPLTDSMAVKFKATIKRVSDKPRNQKNTANEKERHIIDKYKKALGEKQNLKPVLEESGGKMQFYAPIVTNAMCLQCHGTPTTQIKPDVMSKIATLYPQDQAKGYKANQVRGIWRITFNR